MKMCQMLVADFCNPSYSGGRDQEYHNSKPSGANSSSSRTPSYKIPSLRGASGVAQDVDPLFKHWVHKKILKNYKMKVYVKLVQ
jgi:hypothetical protein